jgi:hypothetical protein
MGNPGYRYWITCHSALDYAGFTQCQNTSKMIEFSRNKTRAKSPAVAYPAEVQHLVAHIIEVGGLEAASMPSRGAVQLAFCPIAHLSDFGSTSALSVG